MSDMSNYSKEHWDEDIKRFAEEWGEGLCKAILKMVDGVHDDEDVENLKEEYGEELLGKIKKLVQGNLEGRELKLFIEGNREFHSEFKELAKKKGWLRKGRKLPGTPYRKGDFIGEYEQYEVYDVLGMGGFGIVYLVYGYYNLYALKTFRDEYLEDDEARERFKKEVHAWIELELHPHIAFARSVQIISGRPYVVAEYIAPDEEGLNTLDGYLKHRPPDIVQSLKWSIQFCHGMEYAYSKGIRAHRDIKPANILIGYDKFLKQDKVLKITDFGLAGVIGSARISGAKLGFRNNTIGLSCQTMEGSGFGTPTHMPPEQFTNAAACDERSDIYSFGIVLYQMATGGSFPFLPKLPKNEGFWQDMYRLHCQAPVPKLDSPLFPIIQRCLEKDPNRRYRSFMELRSDLEPLLKRLTGEWVKLPEYPSFNGRRGLWRNKGISLENIGKYQEAIDCYDKALEMDPKYADAWRNKGDLLFELGKYQEAIVCYDKMIEIKPNTSHRRDMKVERLAELGKYQEAIACYDKMIDMKPTDSYAWTSKGDTLFKMGKYEEAIACLDKELEINPRDADVWSNKGISLRSLGRHQEAIVCYDKALEINPRDADVWRGKGYTLFKMGKYEEAIACYDKAIEIKPRYAEAWSNKGLVLHDLGKYQEAIACYDKALEINSKYATAWNNKGAALYNLSEYQEAIEAFENFIKFAPEHSDRVAKINGIIEKLKAKVRDMGRESQQKGQSDKDKSFWKRLFG